VTRQNDTLWDVGLGASTQVTADLVRWARRERGRAIFVGARVGLDLFLLAALDNEGPVGGLLDATLLVGGRL
jgi:hypothetical protein